MIWFFFVLFCQGGPPCLVKRLLPQPTLPLEKNWEALRATQQGSPLPFLLFLLCAPRPLSCSLFIPCLFGSQVEEEGEESTDAQHDQCQVLSSNTQTETHTGLFWGGLTPKGASICWSIFDSVLLIFVLVMVFKLNSGFKQEFLCKPLILSVWHSFSMTQHVK